MSRIEEGISKATGDSTVKVIIDINPDYRENTQFVDSHAPGEIRAQARLKSFLDARGIRYFAVGDVTSSSEMAEAIKDYVGNNLGEADKFVVVCDRKPGDLDKVLGPLQDQFAGIFSV